MGTQPSLTSQKALDVWQVNLRYSDLSFLLKYSLCLPPGPLTTAGMWAAQRVYLLT